MMIIVIELFLYIIMAALIKQLTHVSGLWISLGFGLFFTVLCYLPGEWIIMPLLLCALLLPCLIQWRMPLYMAIGLAVVPSLGIAWAMHHYQSPSLLSGGNVALPPGIGAVMPALMGQ